jgi:hypothetical protein
MKEKRVVYSLHPLLGIANSLLNGKKIVFSVAAVAE